VLDYGAYNDGTNATATTTAIQNALNSGGKMVYVPAGTYKLDSNLSVPQGVSIKGDGQGSTIFDASTIDYTTLSAASSIIEVAEITPTALPDLASPASVNDKEITLASAPSVEVGDIILIYNPTDGSWIGNRNEYRAGEYLKVSAVSGSTLRFEGSIVDNYAVADVDLYKMDMGYCSMTSFTIKCKPKEIVDAPDLVVDLEYTITSQGTTDFTLVGAANNNVGTTFTATGPGIGTGQAEFKNSIHGLTLNHCKHSVVRDVEVITAPYTAIAFNMCFDVTGDNCRATDNFEDEFGGEYGLAVFNSTYVTVKDCHLCAQRHGLTTGGGDGIGRITNRFLNYVNNHVATEGTVQALDVHGNSEYVNISNNIIDGGIDFGGDYINISNNHFMGKTVNGSAIYFTEVKGLHISITGNTIKSDFQDLSRGNLIDCGGNSQAFDSNATRGGILQISNNTLIYDAPLSDADNEYDLINVVNRGYNGNEPISISVQNNTGIARNEFADPNSSMIQSFLLVNVDSGRHWDLITINNNTGSGGLAISTSVDYSANTVSITNNTLKGGEQVTVNNAKNICTFVGNSFENIKVFTGSAGNSTNPTKTVRISDNVYKDCFWGRTSSGSTNVVILCLNAENAYVANNFITGANKKLRTNGLPSSPAFQLGETITGGTSGATAVVYDTAAEYLLIKDSAVGTFTNSETITGGTSGATATLFSAGAYVSTKDYSRAFDTITNLYTGANADTELTTEYKNAITNDIAL